MIRNLKVLGLALVAVFALSAVAASAASAQNGKLTADGPVTLTGTETGGTANNKTTMFGTSHTCEGSTYTGHKVLTHAETTTREEMKETTHPFIENGAETITITPHYNQTKCLTAGTFRTTVDMNGCDYVLHLGATTGVDEYAVTMDIVCPAGKDITKTFFFNATEHAENKPFSVIHIEPQTGKTGGRAKDTTNGTIDLTGTFTGIKATKTCLSHPLFCPKEETTTEGKWDVDINVTGHNEEGGATSIGLSHL